MDNLLSISLKCPKGVEATHADDSTGYLIASSQGTNTCVINNRAGANEYVGTFQIINSESIDGASETDGIDVTNFPLGSAFPAGLFIAQDGTNPGANQNFKGVPWQSIVESFKPPLTVSTAWDPRMVGK